jgi:hypothetical protein
MTLEGIAPHPIPLPAGDRDGVRGPHVKEINAFVLVIPPTGCGEWSIFLKRD